MAAEGVYALDDLEAHSGATPTPILLSGLLEGLLRQKALGRHREAKAGGQRPGEPRSPLSLFPPKTCHVPSLFLSGPWSVGAGRLALGRQREAKDGGRRPRAPIPPSPSLLIFQGPPTTHPSFWPSGRLAHSIREPAADNARLPTEDADRPPSPTTADHKSIPAAPIRPQRTIYRSKTTLQQKAIKSIPVGDHHFRSGSATSSSADLRTGIEHNPDLRPSTGRSPPKAQ